MTTCPTCGAQNDPVNRFCDQCGTRIDAAPAPATSAGFVPPDQPTVSAPACPNCGAVILPGEAFCDNCGADLTAVPAAPAPVAADAPTMMATPTASPTPVAAPTGGVRCPACGQANLPGEAFCDNCGASLTAPAATATPTPEAAPVPIPVVSPDDATILAPPPVVPVERTPVAPPPVAPDDATMLAEAPTAPAVTPAVEPGPAATPVAEPQATPVAGADPAAYAARKAELEAEIGRQQQIIAQFEQMQAMFGATAPAAVTAGLAEARVALAKVEADLAGLTPPAPAVDPEAVRELEAEIGRQQQIIAQFEQMQAMFGAATPAAVTAGLAEARVALAQATADLTDVTGAPPRTSVAPAVPVAPATPAAVPTLPTTPTPIAPPPPPPPSASAPRLVVDGGQTLSLPADRAEIIIGREDPVSNIFPEIDLTSFGGEAGGVSRQHAKITKSGGQWMIADLNSTNFTRVDGVRLEPYVDTPLHDGARVQFGRVVTTFHI